VKGLDAFVVKVDELDIIQLLQQKVTGVIENTGRLVLVHGLQEALKGNTVMQVFAGMNLKAAGHIIFSKGIQYGTPAFGQFLETGFHQARRALRPGIHGVPQQGT